MTQIREGWRGRFFEDFTVGDVYVHGSGRSVSEVDNTWFTLLTCNTHPVHFNAQYGSKTEFGRCLMNSTFTLALVAGMSVDDLSLNAVANLGWENVRLPAPVFAGDTLYGESRVLETRPSASRPYAGLVKVETVGRNQDGVEVITFMRTFMVYRSGQAPSDELAQMRRDWVTSEG